MLGFGRRRNSSTDTPVAYQLEKFGWDSPVFWWISAVLVIYTDVFEKDLKDRCEEDVYDKLVFPMEQSITARKWLVLIRPNKKMITLLLRFTGRRDFICIRSDTRGS